MENQIGNGRTYSDLILDFAKLDAHVGNKQNQKIILLMDKSYCSLVCVLFCIFRGHTFVPIFHGAKNYQDTLNLISADRVLTLAETEKILNQEPDQRTFTPRPLNPDDTAYIISTSGTTGKPKLIPISYANFAAYLDNIFPIIKHPSKFCLLQNFEISFDPYLFDVVSVIFNQSTIMPIPHNQLRHLAGIIDSITREVWISLTPSQGDLIVSLLPEKIWPKITCTFFLGEKLKTSLCLEWLRFFPSTRIYNMYGPAEITVSIFHHAFNSEQDNKTYVPIGEIHPGHAFKVDADGELSIKGPQVFKSYIGEPANGSWFNTHDTVEIVDSNIYIIGRSDFQVKINGRRFQPEEMELFLNAAGINGLVIPVTTSLTRKDKNHLVFVTENPSLQVDDLLKALQSRYDIDFIPKRVLHFQKFPLSQNGKIDRKQILISVMATEPK